MINAALRVAERELGPEAGEGENAGEYQGGGLGEDLSTARLTSTLLQYRSNTCFSGSTKQEKIIIYNKSFLCGTFES